MSVASITYANRMNIKLPGDQMAGGVMSAWDTVNTNFYNFTGTYKKNLILAPAADYAEELILTMSNGVKVYLKYKVTATSTTRYTLQAKTVFRTDGGTLITESSLNTTYIDFNPQHSYRPFENCVITAAQTVYQTQKPTVANDPADILSFLGLLFAEKPAVEGGPIDLSGTVSGTDIGRDWAIISVSDNIYNDTDLTNFKNAIIAGGDGSDPFTTDPVPEDPDPSGTGGGDVPSTDGGDAVDFPGLPTVSVLNTGLISAYNPNNTLLRSLATVLWGNDFEQSIKKILNDPFDGIIGLSALPFTPHTAGSVNCQIGNFDTEVLMPLVDTQYYTLDCGSLVVNKSWNNALDYSPNSSVDIFIPFVGFKSLSTEDCMGKTISLKYNVDIFTGAAIAMIKCGDKVLYTYPCKLSYDIPLTGSNKAALYTGMINVAMSAIRGAAMGGALGAVGGAATSAIQTATSKQSDVERSGSIASNTGSLGEFVPYIVIHRPVQSMPQNFKKIKGYQSNITAQLGQLSGYTEVDYIHLTGITGATDTELQEIETLLKNGVII